MWLSPANLSLALMTECSYVHPLTGQEGCLVLTEHLPSAFQTLHRHARRYAKTEADAARLAERALQTVASDPTLLDDPDFEKVLFALVQRIAQQRE
jgi:hypothetical protein